VPSRKFPEGFSSPKQEYRKKERNVNRNIFLFIRSIFLIRVGANIEIYSVQLKDIKVLKR